MDLDKNLRVLFFHQRLSTFICDFTPRPPRPRGYGPSETVEIVIRGRATVRVDGAIVRDHWAQFCAAATNIIDHSVECCRSRSVEDPWLASVIRSLEGDPQKLSREAFALIELRAHSIEWIGIDGPTFNCFAFDLTPE